MQQEQSHNTSKGKDSKGKGEKKSKGTSALSWREEQSSWIPAAASAVTPVTSPQSRAAASTGATSPRGANSSDEAVVGSVDIAYTSREDAARPAPQTFLPGEAASPAPRKRWLAINLDTGAGGTVWPADADYANEKTSCIASCSHRTATGELVEGLGGYMVHATDEWGRSLRFKGEKTHVHKPLLSAGMVTDKGHTVWLDGDAGYLITNDSPILREMRALYKRLVEVHSWNGVHELVKERGIYNLYVQVEAERRDDGRTVDVSPNEMEMEAPTAPEGASSSGGHRQANGL